MKRFLTRTACVAGALCACLSQPALGAQPASVVVGGVTPPAACATKQLIEPRTAGWAFVVNFDTFGAFGEPIGCLVVYRLPRRATDFVPMPCKVISNGANLAFSAGRATFAGGYLYCQANIQAELAALNPPIAVNAVENYPYFTLIGVGALSDTLASVITYSNPIAYYAPTDASKPDAGLFAPLNANGGQIISRFNSTDNIGAFQNAGNLTANQQYTFTIEHDGLGATLTTTHYLDEVAYDAFGPRGPVSFATNGGRFYVGYTPLGGGATLYGTFDEVIFDPPDGGRPPSRQLGAVYDIWLPLLAR